MRVPRQFIIEGVDRMGKSTLIEGLLQELGYHLVVHYDKPKRLTAYNFYEAFEGGSLLAYQNALYYNMFCIINSGARVIFDRGHLGEVVYAPMYRSYDGEYVFDCEHGADTGDTRLVLLTTSDFSFIKDDGLSLDFSKKEEEQAAFVKAFDRSSIKDKVQVDVSNGRGGYKKPDEILAEVLKTSVLPSQK